MCMTEEEMEAVTGNQPTDRVSSVVNQSPVVMPSVIMPSAINESLLVNEPANNPLTKEQKKELALINAGITDELLFSVAHDGLTAVKEVEDFDAQGNVRVVKKADHMIRHKYFDTILRVKGYIRADASIESTVNFNLTVSERNVIKDRLRKVIDV